MGETLAAWMLPLRIDDTLLNELRIEKHSKYNIFLTLRRLDFLKMLFVIQSI